MDTWAGSMVIGSVGDGFEDPWHGDLSLGDRSRENFA